MAFRRNDQRQTRGKKIRVTLDLSVPLYERLQRLQELVDADTKADVIRQALQLYEYLATHAANGAVFKMVDSSGNEDRLALFVTAPIPGFPAS
jgi:hypothetical protein